MIRKSGNAPVNAIRPLRRIGARSAQDGSTARENAGNGSQVQRHVLIFHQATPSFEEADEIILVVKSTFAYHCADDGIQAGTVAPTGQHANFHFDSCAKMKKIGTACLECTSAPGTAWRSPECRATIVWKK